MAKLTKFFLIMHELMMGLIDQSNFIIGIKATLKQLANADLGKIKLAA